MKKQLTDLETKMLQALTEVKEFLGHVQPRIAEQAFNEIYETVEGAMEEATADVPVLMEKFWPESSQVERTKYLPESSTLEVEFKGKGSVYHYFQFPLEAWEKLFFCTSIGTHLNKEVKGKYEYKLQEGAAAPESKTNVSDL